MTECLRTSAFGYKKTFMSLSLLSSLFNSKRRDVCFTFRPPASLRAEPGTTCIRLAVPYSLPVADNVGRLLGLLLTDGLDLSRLTEWMSA